MKPADYTKPGIPAAITGLDRQGLALLMPGQPAFRAKQLFEYLYSHRESFPETLDDCTVLPAALRTTLSESLPLRSTRIDCKIADGEGAVKYRILLHDELPVEAVVLVDGKGRRTACLSSQAGCKMGCRFCRTASLGFSRNLSCGEILEQVKWIESDSGTISNIVFMGMGEPLDNFDNLMQAISILTDEKGFGIGRRRITVSTCGLADEILKLAEAQSGVRLAISLNSAIPGKRLEIMPIERRFSLDVLKKSLIEYQRQCAGKRITLEYVMLGGKNLSRAHAEALIRFTKGLKVLVNLIPLNGSEDIPYAVPSGKECSRFEQQLTAGGLNVTRRMSKGGDIEGACGQLAAKDR